MGSRAERWSRAHAKVQVGRAKAIARNRLSLLAVSLRPAHCGGASALVQLADDRRATAHWQLATRNRHRPSPTGLAGSDPQRL